VFSGLLSEATPYSRLFTQASSATATMAVGAVVEPLIIVSLLAGGTLVNGDKSRATSPSTSSHRPDPWQDIEYALKDNHAPHEEYGLDDQRAKELNRSRSSSASTSTIWHDVDDGKAGSGSGPSLRRKRTLRFWKWQCEITSPNTEVHKDRFLSRVLKRYPFLVEVWYWALIYWVRNCSCPSYPLAGCIR